MSEFIDELISIMGRLHKHRSFWLWPKKSVMELGIVRELLDSMHHDGDIRYRNARSVNADWPDCEVDDVVGNTVAAEVTELVDEEAVRRAQRDEIDFSYWRDDEIREQIGSILTRKDRKSSHGLPLKPAQTDDSKSDGFPCAVALYSMSTRYLEFLKWYHLNSVWVERSNNGLKTRWLSTKNEQIR